MEGNIIIKVRPPVSETRDAVGQLETQFGPWQNVWASRLDQSAGSPLQDGALLNESRSRYEARMDGLEGLSKDWEMEDESGIPSDILDVLEAPGRNNRRWHIVVRRTRVN